MEKHSDLFNILIGIYMVVGGLCIVKVILDIIRNWNGDDHLYIPSRLELRDFPDEEEMYHQGYVFCNVFRTEDIHAIAKNMGLALTKEDVIKLIHDIKKDFTLTSGIDKHRIEMYIRIIVQRKIQKQ